MGRAGWGPGERDAQQRRWRPRAESCSETLTGVLGLTPRVPGIVSVCPYYNRPGQDGLAEHFRRIAGATDREILIYNIPYRTSVNLANDTLLELAAVPNIVGVKDSAGA